MNITVYYKEENFNTLLPQPLRAILVGSSGSGKTNLLLNLIYKRESGLKFTNLYVFSKSLEQRSYLDLKKHYKKVEDKIGEQISYFYNSCEDLISVDECEENSLVIFDDCLMEEQTKIKDYFIRGRHKNISCIYLSQSYSHLDLRVIRNNVNFLCIFRQNKYYTKRIFEDYVGSEMTLDQFENLCYRCWNIPFGFLTIDMRKKPHNGKYSCMLNETLNVN